jgi:hypothetical protein
MSSYTQKDNSGSLFKNTRREKDTHPHLTGKVMIDGKMFYASAWTKERENGEKWISLSFKPVETKEEADRGARAERPFADDLNDTIPF